MIGAASLLYGTFDQMWSSAPSIVTDENYRRIVSIEVVRHGERDPGDLYGLAEPEFDGDDKNLTKVGARTQYDLGQKLRNRSNMAGIVDASYSANQVYTMSTFKDRAYDSAVAQLMGAYDIPFDLPLPSAESLGFDIKRPDQLNDWILRNDDDSCKRVAQIETAIEEDPGTVGFFEKTNAYMEKDFYPRLRDIVGMPDATTEETEDVVNYIDWAIWSDMKLKFDLTEDDKRLISMAD